MEAITASPTLIKQLGKEAIQQREASYWDNWITQPDPAFVAIDGNGYAVGAIVLQPDKPSVWRIGIGVEATVRGRGVGTMLIEQALSFASLEAAPHISLTVDPTNARAHALYHRLGFVEIGTQHGLILMRKSL